MVALLAVAKFLMTFLLAFATFSHATGRYNYQRLKETNMVFYMHDSEAGPNASSPIVVGLPGKKWGFVDFGTFHVSDCKLTEGSDPNSAEVGRSQGIYVDSAVDGSDMYLLMSIVFTNKQYNGSTLEIHGADRFYNKYREVSVVSGTGMFRLVRGYAILETASMDLSKASGILKWNVSLFHF